MDDENAHPQIRPTVRTMQKAPRSQSPSLSPSGGTRTPHVSPSQRAGRSGNDKRQLPAAKGTPDDTRNQAGSDNRSPSPSDRAYLERPNEEGNKTPEGPTERFGNIGKETPHTKSRWTEKKEVELCYLWQEERNLYDATLNDYRRNDRRQASIAKIAAKLGMDGRCTGYFCWKESFECIFVVVWILTPFLTICLDVQYHFE